VREFIYTLFSFLPFMVCLVWLTVYVADYRRASLPKRLLTFFALVCTLLYFCHSWFFMVEKGHYGVIDVLYLFCNLTVYPLFYCYLLLLTKGDSFSPQTFLVLLPAPVFAVLAGVTGGHVAVLTIAKVLFAFQVLNVGVFGLRALKEFNREVRNYYSDTEGKTLNSTTVLLVCFLVFAVLSSVANMIGREFFLDSLLLGIPSIIFSTMLFALFHVSSRIRFSARDFHQEVMADDATIAEESVADDGEVQLEAKIAAAMEEQKLYLTPGLKISDVALAVGSNRTYVSNAVNDVAKMSFSDYINSRRVEYAKQKMLETEDDYALSTIATDSGFASFPSFYRAFIKFTGTSPSTWMKGQKG